MMQQYQHNSNSISALVQSQALYTIHVNKCSVVQKLDCKDIKSDHLKSKNSALKDLLIVRKSLKLS